MHARPSRVLAAIAGLAVAGGLLAAPSTAAPASPVPVTAPVDAPTPDILDIDMTTGAAVDEAQSIPTTVHGAPTFGDDAKQGQTVMTVDGVDDAVSFPIESEWPKLTNGWSIECVFKINTAMPVSSEKDLCSDKEGGGFSIYVTGGNLGTMAHIGGGYKSALAPIDGNRWYHAVSVWDGSTISLYVNGRLAASSPAAGNLQLPAATAQRFVVGADASPTGIGQIAPPSSFAASAVFSTAVSEDQVTAMAAEWDTSLDVPQADILDVDFADGTPVDHAQGLASTTYGAPVVADDRALGKPTATMDGVDDAFGYAFGQQWPAISDSVSIECTFRMTVQLPVNAEKALCSSKEGGGYSVYLNDTQVGFMAHIGGGYKTARAPIEANRWYHVVATWNGTAMRLFVNGELAAETPATGALTLPSVNGRPRFIVGGDTNNSTGAQFFAPAVFSNARVYSEALGAAQVDALSIDALGEFPDAGVELTSSTPASGDHLTEPVEFAVDVANADNANEWSYTLDGEPIEPGDTIGAGLKSGDHTVRITAVDVFGEQIDWEIPFTSDTIPAGGGTGDGQGGGTVSLSALATSPDGSDVTTTFREATASVADGGFQGSVGKLPTTLEFAYDEDGAIEGRQAPDDELATASPSSKDIPFQRFDVEVPASVRGQQVVWSGVVDPARSVSLRAWSLATERWVELASARGSMEGETVLNARLREGFLDDSGEGATVHLLVAGIDPFADDLAPRDESAKDDKDRFEDPADYDFSMAHFTDTQYLAEGAAGGTYDDWDGVAEPKDVMQAEEEALWEKAYEDTTRWITDNADDRKIAFTAHTGDVIENDYHDPLATDGSGNLLYPGLNEQVDREFDFTQGAHDTMDSAGIVNQVIAGNHDNQLGNETGPDSRFNQWYGPERYYDAAQQWPSGASYHAWDETTDEQGNTTAPGEDNQNNYVLFSAGGLDFVSVGLSYGVTQEEADWASSIFERYPDRNGVLLTHAYIAPSTAPDGRGSSFSADGSRLFSEVVADNPNVFLVLAGHEHGVGTNLKTGLGVTVSHNVVELLADYQFYKLTADELFPGRADAAGNIDLNGDGVTDHKKTDLLQFGASFLRLLQFDVDRSEMSIDTYSPMLDNFGATEYDDRNRYNGAEDNLTLPVDLTTRTTTFETDGLTVVTPTDEVIGTATARSGWPATVEWSGLTEGEVYAWVADSRTAAGAQLGTVNQFGTVFLATAAGTDATPPTIAVPEATEVTVGEVFDPLAGVTATDDTDGDVTDRIQVVGEVNTEEPGSYALTYVADDTNGNQVIMPRVVKVVAPDEPELTPTTVSAGNVRVAFGDTLRLQATVSPAAASGAVQFLNGEEVLCEAVVAEGTAACRVPTLPPPGDYVVTAVYAGDEAHAPSQKTFVLTVTQPVDDELVDPRLRAWAADTTVERGKPALLKAAVVTTATGKVRFAAKGRTLCVAKIKAGKASCTTGSRLPGGRYKVVATYRGDAGHLADRDTFTFRKARR